MALPLFGIGLNDALAALLGLNSNSTAATEPKMTMERKRGFAEEDEHSTNTQSNKRQKLSSSSKKRVRFATNDTPSSSNSNSSSTSNSSTMDSDAPVQTQCRVFERVEHDEKPLVWWTSDEVGHIHRRERSMISILTCLCDTYVQQLTRLLEISAAPPSDHNSSEDNDEELCHLWLADNQGRGLESEVSHFIGNTSRAPKTVVQKTLQLQWQLRVLVAKQQEEELEAGNPYRISPDLQSEILCAHYQQLSHPNTQLARLLAVGDARAAALVHVPEEEGRDCVMDTSSDDTVVAAVEDTACSQLSRRTSFAASA